MNPQTATRVDSLALAELHDIVVPAPVSWAPQTAGWYLLLLLLLVLLVYVVVKMVRRYQAAQYRREALAELAQLELQAAEPARRTQALSRLPVLLKRTALSVAPRARVARLTGEEWLRLLDRSYQGAGFTQGPGRRLDDLAYRSVELSEIEARDLLRLVRVWIRKHDGSLLDRVAQ